MNIRLSQASKRDHKTVDRLFQLYLHDFDSYLKQGVQPDGRYALDFDLKAELNKPGFWTHLAFADDNLVGFTMIRDYTVFQQPGRYVLEFFVVRGWRRQGIGKQMAHRLFDLYSGYWEVVQIAPNKPAIAFWKKSIEAYVGSNYQETETHEDNKHYIWQMFDSSKHKLESIATQKS